MSHSGQPGITLTHKQLEQWAGRPLTNDEVARLDAALPHSSLPDLIWTVVDACTTTTGNDDPEH